MLLPAKEDYTRVLSLLMNQFERQLEEQAIQERPQGRRGRRFSYSQRVLLLFFLQMHHQRRTGFQAQHRWLLLHQSQARRLGFTQVPHRTTLMRRYKQLSRFLEPLIAFIGQWARALAPVKASVAGARLVLHDKSLWKASGPVRPAARCGTSATVGLRWCLRGSSGWTRTPPGARAATTAGFLAMACT